MATGPLLLLLLHQSCMPLVPFDNGLLETFSEHPTHLPLYLHSLLFISPLIFLSRRKKSDGCGLHTHAHTHARAWMSRVVVPLWLAAGLFWHLNHRSLSRVKLARLATHGRHLVAASCLFLDLAVDIDRWILVSRKNFTQMASHCHVAAH